MVTKSFQQHSRLLIVFESIICCSSACPCRNPV